MKKNVISPREELSMVQSELIDQYYRALRGIKAYKAEICNLPRGSIVMKSIADRKYPYLQWREGSKVCSKYIKKDELEEIEKKIELRKIRERSVKRLEKSARDIEKFIGKDLLEYYGDK
ncbi:MAG: hypothetical protein IJ796_10190 [Lachnospiraceae bacterium]|nr:hypothetical protein [Lachnospiraceae bacterium]